MKKESAKIENRMQNSKMILISNRNQYTNYTLIMLTIKNRLN